MNKEFDEEIALRIYKYLNKNHDVEKKPLFISISNDLDCWKKVYTLELFEQFLFIRYYTSDKGIKLLDDKNYIDWIKQHQDYIFYDPRPKIIQKIDYSYRGIKYNLLSKYWWKIKYWKLRYGVKWKNIKMNSKWNNPIFVYFDEKEIENEKETTN